HLALAVDEGQARPDVRVGAVDGHAGAELADDEFLARAPAAPQRAGPVHVDPLRLIAAFAVEHLHAVVLAVGDVHPALGVGEDVVRVDVQPVGAGDYAFAPGAEEISLAIEHHHRVLAAVEAVDAILAVHGDGGDVLELPAVGKLRPVLHYAVTVSAGAEVH